VEVYVFDAGHFALNTKVDESTTLVREFVTKQKSSVTQWRWTRAWWRGPCRRGGHRKLVSRSFAPMSYVLD
jgi:hypothetical protein